MPDPRDRVQAALVGSAQLGRLAPDEFAQELARSSRLLWCLAAAVLGEGAGADDVLQEAALIALQKLDEFAIGTHFPGWMGQIVRYTALNHRRKRERLRSLDVKDTEEVEDLAGRTGLTGSSEMFDDRLLRALRELSETARTCLLMRTVLELEYREIARALSIPEGTAMTTCTAREKPCGACSIPRM